MTVINTNISSLTAQRNLATNQASLGVAMQRLSSGLRINSAKDDAAGLSISERMTSQIRGSDQAARNANDGISLSQTAEGDLTQISANLQRMRELAVQSANGTNSVSDRAALNGEVQALSAEIDRVSQNSSFNGVKLLDGSFVAQKFQVGANGTATDSISIDSIASARTSQLGGVGVSSAASVTTGPATGALAAGDLTLNGFQVGATGLGVAPGQSPASASSIAAAINAISSNSGVTAVANANTLSATASNFGPVLANSFSVNGVNVGAIAAGTNAAGQGANVAAAINAVATQSGVNATADATTGAVTLTAADGRDIAIASAYGQSVSGDASALNTTLKTRIGFDVGTGATATATAGAVVSSDSAAAGTRTLTAANGTVAANTISVTTGGKTYALGAIDLTGTNDQDAAAISAAINAATGAATTSVATNVVTTVVAYKLDVMGIAADLAASVANQANALAQFGASSAAGLIGSQEYTATAPVAATAATTHSTISLSSTSASGIVWAGAAATSAGLAASGTKAATTSSSVSSIASMDVLTAANATKALSAIDGALATISSSRAALGAIQNRFTSVVTSLQTTAENLTASRSRIQDADFALETANLSRSQVLQQAGTAMVAQANQLPQGVLALLRQ